MAVAGVTIDGAVVTTTRPTGGVPSTAPVNGGIASTNDGAMYVVGAAMGPAGTIQYPSGFLFPFGTAFPYGITRSADGAITVPGFNPASLVPHTTIGAANFYVDATSGNDANAGTSWALAKAGIDAMLAAATYPCNIWVRGSPKGLIYAQTNSWNATTPGGTCAVRAVGGKAISAICWTLGISISLDTGTTYTCARSNVTTVMDLTNLGNDGEWTALTYVATAAECRATPGTWSDDSLNVNLWINRSDGAAVTTANTMALLSGVANGKNPTSGDIYVEGIEFIGGNNGAFVCDGNATGSAAFVNCGFKWAGRSSAPRDGLRVLETASAVMIGCNASNNSKDGFNITPTGAAVPVCVTIDCVGRNNGVSPSTSNNGITYHGGALGVDIRGVYERNYGGNVAITDAGTQLWCVGSHSGESLGDVVFGGSFPPTSWQALASSNMWLDSCSGSGSEREFSCNAPGSLLYRNYSTGGGTTAGDGVGEY